MKNLSRRRLLRDAAILGAPVISGPWLAGCEAQQTPTPAPAPLPDGMTEAVVASPLGRFRGMRNPKSGIRIFKGIPFIRNPYTAQTRFRAPIPYGPVDGTLDCLKPGSIPLQPGAGGKMRGGDGPLCLNIWAPSEERGKKRPVMVWVPGGGSIRCDQNDPRFDGTAFAEDGVVLVTLAYRVNVDGFLKIEGGDSNLGIRDIIEGLRWVKANIAAFGGDPDRITAFGQSAGGTHLVDVIASPAAKGLLAGAIIQSPSAVAQWTSDAQAARAARLVADALGAKPTRESLMAVPVEKLPAFGPLAGKLSADLEWAQFTDGNTSLFKGWVDGDIMPARPVDAIARGACAGLAVIAGSTASEWRYYIVPNGRIGEIREKDVEKLLEGAKRPLDVASAYRRAGRGETPGDVFAQIQSDIIFRMPCLKLIESLRKGGARVWAYDFAWQSPVKGKSGAAIGAAHTTDVPFVFKTFDAPRAVASNGSAAPAALADAMHSAWVAFASSGEAPWAAFDLHARQAMVFDEKSAVATDPWAFERMVMPAR